MKMKRNNENQIQINLYNEIQRQKDKVLNKDKTIDEFRNTLYEIKQEFRRKYTLQEIENDSSNNYIYQLLVKSLNTGKS